MVTVILLEMGLLLKENQSWSSLKNKQTNTISWMSVTWQGVILGLEPHERGLVGN